MVCRLDDANSTRTLLMAETPKNALISSREQLALRITGPEFFASLRSSTEKAGLVEINMPGITHDKRFVSRIDGRKFILERRIPMVHNNCAKVLRGEVLESPSGPVIQYSISSRVNLKFHLVIPTILIACPLLYLSLFYLPDNISKANEIPYRICSTLIMSVGVLVSFFFSRAMIKTLSEFPPDQEEALRGFITDIANGKLPPLE